MFKGKKLLWNQLGNIFLVLVIIGSASAATVSYAYRNAVIKEQSEVAKAAAKNAIVKKHVPSVTEAVAKPTEASTLVGEKTLVATKEQAVKKPAQKATTQKRRAVAVKSSAVKSIDLKSSSAVSSTHEEDREDGEDIEDTEDHSDEDSEDSGSDD